MAISSGVGPHFAVANVNGSNLPIISGQASCTATKKSATFSATIPLSYAGARSTLAFLGDNTTSILVSTRGQQVALITGEIDNVEFDYIGRTISISGRDASAKLHKTKSSEKFVNQTPAQVIQTIASRVGLSAAVDAIALQAGRYINTDWVKLTDGVSYASVLHKLCEFMGAHWWVTGSALNVKSTQSAVSPYRINFSDANGVVSDALQLRVRRNVQAGKPISVTVKSWNPRQAKAFVGSSTVGGNGTTQNYVYHLPNVSQDHANQHAKAKASDHARHELEVSAELVGDPSIDVSQPLQLIGTEFAQTFKMDSVSHSFGMAGHTMQISAKSAAQGRSSG